MGTVHGWKVLMMSTQVLPLSSDSARTMLENVKVIYTDLDGTLLAPGGRLLTDDDGTPSIALAQALVALKRIGIEIIIATGRNRMQGAEIMRLLSIDSFIGEMGTVLQRDIGARAQITYCLGDWDSIVLREGLRPGELPHDTTPYEIIAKSGTIERLLTAFPGKLEYHTPWCINREVTHILRGFIDTIQAQTLFDEGTVPLTLLDNGRINPLQHTLKDCDEIHTYHVVPKGTSKVAAVRRDIEMRHLDPATTVAIGDARGDVAMGACTGGLVVVENALASEAVMDALEKRKSAGTDTFYASGSTADGWVAFAQAICEAQGHPF